MKYNIQWNDGTKEVEGKRVVIPDFEQFHFFVHNEKECTWIGWRVSEATSGAVFAMGYDTKKLAVNEAIRVLNSKGVAELKKAIKSKIKKYGVINQIDKGRGK